MINVIKFITGLLFPPKCIFCGQVLDLVTSNLEICTECYKKIPFYEGGIIKNSIDSPNGSACDGIFCACHYSGIIKESLMRFKFYNKSSYYRTFAKLLSNKIKTMTEWTNFDIIISVPLHKDREKSRGYNQSQLISKELSHETGIVANSIILSRTKKTEAQSLLARKDRYLNVKDAFFVNDVQKVKDKNVLLVDDILTTGYTIEGCSIALKNAGAFKVYTTVVASGRKQK